MTGRELLDDRDDGQGLGLVALKAADLQGEPVPVDEQADHDLGVDTALLGVAHLAQRVLVLGLEVQGRHVVQAQRHVPGREGVLEADGGDLVAVLARGGPRQGAAHRLLTGRRPSQVGQDTPGVQDRGGLHDPGDHQVAEGLVLDHAEPEVGVDPASAPNSSRDPVATTRPGPSRPAGCRPRAWRPTPAAAGGGVRAATGGDASTSRASIS